MVTFAQLALAVLAFLAAALVGLSLGDPGVSARIWFSLGAVTFPVCIGFLGVLAALERGRRDRAALKSTMDAILDALRPRA